jgi:peptide deformylase
MKLPLAYYGDPILRQQGKEVEVINDEIRQLIRDMIETLIEHNGIGLSAQQVKRALKIFITAVPHEQPDGSWLPGKLRIFINPKILWVSDKQECRSEGCLSVPKLYLEVERPSRVRIQALDLEGNLFEEEFSGLEGRCVLHENDHVNGVLFMDRIRGKDRQKIESKLREIKKKFSS